MTHEETVEHIVRLATEKTAGWEMKVENTLTTYRAQVLEEEKTNSLEHLILKAYPHIRGIVFHSDGHVDAKTGGRAPKPKKLYSVRPKKDELSHYGEMAKEAVKKLLKENN